MRITIFLVLLVVFSNFSSTYADCINPAGIEGEQVYNSTHKTMQFCDGTYWYSMKGGTVTTLDALSCSNGQIIKWNNGSSIWECANDDSGGAESDPTVAASVKDGVSWAEVSGKPAGFADGVDNTGITSESDPQVATVISGKWCRGTGSAVTCDQDAPSGGITASIFLHCHSNSSSSPCTTPNCSSEYFRVACGLNSVPHGSRCRKLTAGTAYIFCAR